MKLKRKLLAAALCALGLAGTAMVGAQSAGIKRTVLMKADVSVENREAVVARAELDPGASVGKHTHTGDEIGYVLEGEAELVVDGEAPRKLKAGDAYVITSGKAHDAKNTGSTPFKLVAAYVVEKGKPLATPAK
jgi:quercetin dioxygenase-like cupin family protein